MFNRFETHAHSYYSNIRLIDALNSPKKLITKSYELGLKGVCLTDHEALSGHIDFLENEEELKKNGVISQDFKCGLGNEIYLTEDRSKKQKYYHFILIAKDVIGWRQLAKLSSMSWYNCYASGGQKRVPTLKTELKEIISENPGHIIATTACAGGELSTLVCKTYYAQGEEKKELKNKLNNFLKYCDDLFGDDFYIEIAPSEQEEPKLLRQWAKQSGRKIIVGCDAHYADEAERPIHEAYLNSKEEERETSQFYYRTYLMSNNEVFNLISDVFSEEEFEQICKNSMEIYNKIDGYSGIFHTPIIPKVEVKNYPLNVDTYWSNGFKNEFLNNKWPTIKYLLSSEKEQERYWINQCLEALINKELWKEEYIDRIETEADVINVVGQKLNNCMFEYFNTFQHFIDMFWECDSLSGPGRGSSVCFLSNYCLGITQLNPLEYNLQYWRFLNKDRLELPDIDSDLSPTQRPVIFKKIREERGELRLLQVAAFGTEGPRSAVKTACRGYRSKEYPNGIDVDTAQYISSLIPQERGFQWPIHDMMYGNKEKDREPNQAFIDEVSKYEGLIDIIQSIEGVVNKSTQHASGVILYNEDPWNTNAIMRSPNGDLTTQFDLHRSEKLGDTKFDFLVTEICDKLTHCIKLLQKDGYFEKDFTLRQVYEKYLHPKVINLKDQRIWDALASGEVTDVFQFNSDVGLAAAKSIKPQNPTDMMMANALMRLTGEKGKERPIERYIRMKNNIQLWYNECRDFGLTEDEIKVLEPYYLTVGGTPTTQERLMLLCMDEHLGNFSLKDANAARKICAKKQLAKIPELKEKFIGNCPRKEIGEYVWQTAIEPQMSYA